MVVNQPQQPQQQPQQAPQAAPVVTGRYQFRLAAVIWFVAAVIDIFLAGDFLFRLLGASKASAFVNFVYQISAIFSAPFHGIWPAVANKASYLDPADLVAIVVYAVVAWGLITLVKIATAPSGSKPAVGG